MTKYEMIKKLAELAKNNVTIDEHKQMAEDYDELAKHYEELVSESRRHAASHRAAM